jgi:hypothetical protein
MTPPCVPSPAPWHAGVATCSLRQLLLELARRHRRREPAEGARGRLRLPLVRGGRHAVGQRDHVEALLVSGAHGRLDAAVGEEAGEGDGLDAARLELRLQSRARGGRRRDPG